MNPKLHLIRFFRKLSGIFGGGQIASIGVVILIALLVGTVLLMFVNFTVPDTITIASGPKGSSFERYAKRYKEILARQGVQVNILPSQGSLDNFKKLSDPRQAVDVGFVLSGEVTKEELSRKGGGNLMSLGSISYQPLMIFYRGKPRQLLSDFKGQRLDIGPEGSGAHTLARMLLKANEIEPGDGTTFVESVSGDLVRALLNNEVDAIFVMSDSTASDMMRGLLHTPDVHLFNFTQADGYTRRINYLNKLDLPRGSLDFGKDIPAENTALIGPTVELIARETLHPALSDLLLEAAREVHGTASLFKKRGEFPAPQEHEFRLSPDASRYYTSGKSYFYRMFPFGIANIITRVVAFLVPFTLLLVPGLRLVPAIYRWRIESRIHRWYRVLLDLERDAFNPSADPKRREELLKHLDHIEQAVSHITIPASFGDLFYGLRGHIRFVRTTLQTQMAQTPESR